MATLLTPTGSPSVFGGIGKLEFAPTNAPDDPFPTWVDITPYLRTEGTPVTITRGRQTELDVVQPSQLTAVLDNTDNRFTFGLTTGPYGANWTPAKKVRYSETIGQRTFVLFTGWIEFPDIDSWQPIGYQEVSLSCTDRLTRLGRGQPFASTMAAHIMGSGRNALRGYWPLTDAAQIFQPLVGSSTAIVRIATGTLNPVETQPTVLPQSGDQVPGDDVKPVRLVIGTNAGQMAWSPYIEATSFAGRATLSAGQVATVIVWAKADLSLTPAAHFLSFATWDGLVDLGRAVGGDLHLTSPLGALTGSLSTGVMIGSDHYYMIGIRYGFTPNVLELWVDDQIYTTTLSGVFAGPGAVYAVDTGPAIQGSVAHLQVYVGSPTDWTHADFLAQRQIGLTGLEYQSTGQRINTILDYAGVPAGDRAVDPGVSYMQKATLAGQTPQTALQNAVTTERGRGFAAGDGRYVFHDRTRVLNV